MSMDADFIAIDLTSLCPSWVDASEASGRIHPVFCLPIEEGEPPLVGEEARLHRRGTRTSSHPSESYFDPANRSRWHLAEGWVRASQKPDSLRTANTEFTWTPPGSTRPLSVSFEKVLVELLSPYAERTSRLGLVVPDGLGPGPQQKILGALATLATEIHLIPRPVAIALDWLENQGKVQGAEDCDPGQRTGEILVTSACSDFWESALVPIRAENRGGIRTVCPVHDRTRPQGDSPVVGLAWAVGDQPRGTVPERLREILASPDQLAECHGTTARQEEALALGLIPGAQEAAERSSLNEFLEQIKT